MTVISKNDFPEGNLTVQNVLNRVSEIILWRYYIGQDFRLNKPFSAPYREDKNPSFVLRFDGRGRLMFKDFGRPGAYGDIFNYLQLVHGLDFVESLEWVNEDFGLNLRHSSPILRSPRSGRHHREQRDRKLEIGTLSKFEHRIKSSQILIQSVIRHFEKQDYDDWWKYGISQETLKKYQVYAARKVFKNKQLVYSYYPENPCYIYYFPKTKHIKCYLPKCLDRSRRFFGNANNLEDLQGYYQCDVKGNRTPEKLLVLTKSMKDVMLLREYGIDAMALHGEGHKFEDDFIRHIKKYYSKIVSLYDRDKAGILAARRLWKDHKIKPFFINKWYKAKDISDMYLVHGPEIVSSYLNDLKQRS